MISGKILCTGGSGSWSKELTKQLLNNPEVTQITLFARNESQMVKREREFNNTKLKFILGDVAVYEEILNACKGQDYVFHLAATKHVPVCEEQPSMAIRTNIIGTSNVIKVCKKQGVKVCVQSSSDKAVEPINIYGATKIIGEKLIVQANQEGDTKFVCVRAGNVIGSAGSVIPMFIEKAKKNLPLTLTCGKMTRYYMLLPQAIKLLLKATEEGIGGEIFVTKMSSVSLQTLAEVIVQSFNSKSEIIETYFRPGEKMHECLVSKNEVTNTVEFDNDYYVILPVLNLPKVTSHYSSCPKVKFKSYKSSDYLMTKHVITLMLEEGGFLS